MSLLSKAKAITADKIHHASEAEPEMVELAVAYAKHEVTMQQVAKACGFTPAKAHSRIQHALMSGVRTGQLTFKK